jgi:transposase-like protein
MENHEKKNYTPQEKVAILKRHLVEKKTVPDWCDEYHLSPRVFDRWLKIFFDNGAVAFGPPPRAERQVEERQQRIAFLEAKLKKKDEVLAELMEEHVALKKSLGEV